jgi:hypothetical protein
MTAEAKSQTVRSTNGTLIGFVTVGSGLEFLLFTVPSTPGSGSPWQLPWRIAALVCHGSACSGAAAVTQGPTPSTVDLGSILLEDLNSLGSTDLRQPWQWQSGRAKRQRRLAQRTGLEGASTLTKSFHQILGAHLTTRGYLIATKRFQRLHSGAPIDDFRDRVYRVERGIRLRPIVDFDWRSEVLPWSPRRDASRQQERS